MKHLKTTVIILLVIATVLGQVVYAQNVKVINNQGGYSLICGNITDADRQWVLERFGGYPNISMLMLALEHFACKNFKYTKDGLRPSQKIAQHFDMGHFIASDFRGVCFDFACFCKNVILICCEARSIPVKAYVCGFLYGMMKGHAVNFIYDEKGTCYYLDLTSDSTYYRMGRVDLIRGAICLEEITPADYLKATHKDLLSYTMY